MADKTERDDGLTPPVFRPADCPEYLFPGSGERMMRLIQRFDADLRRVGAVATVSNDKTDVVVVTHLYCRWLAGNAHRIAQLDVHDVAADNATKQGGGRSRKRQRVAKKSAAERSA
jgi:broad specificity phosphatase PhoE